MEIHEFMINKNGELSQPAQQLPIIREHIESIPETKAVFRLRHIDDISVSRIREKHLEFLGAWSVPDYFDRRTEYKGTTYVNPNYVHSSYYSDMTLRCGCGGLITRSMGDGNRGLDRENEHTDDCKLYQRHRKKAELLEHSYDKIVQLGKIGWSSREIADRFDISNSVVCGQLDRHDEKFNDLKAEFRKLASNTYSFLVNARGISADKVADVYGYSKNHIRHLRREYGSEDYSDVFDKYSGGPTDRFSCDGSTLVKVR